MELSILLKKFREDKNLTIKELSEKSGVGNGTIGEIERGKNKSRPKTLEKLSKALGLNDKEKKELFASLLPEEMRKSIIKSENSREFSNVKMLSEEQLISIPVRAKASAGNGYINFGEERIYNKMIRKNGFNENCYLIEVAGNSMEPVIQDGAFVVVDPQQTEYIDNKIYVVKYGDEVYIKRVIIKKEQNLMILKSINASYEDIYITSEKSDSVKIIGRAVKFIFEGNL